MIKKLTSPPILGYADFSKPFILHTDSSGEGLGSVLYQVQDGVERVIGYASRSDWKSYVAPMVYAYNATCHESTQNSPFFLMFGRHPRLAVDAFLGDQVSNISDTEVSGYIDKLKNRLAFAYILVGYFGFNGPLRQYFSLYRAVSQREGERGERIDESKNVQTAPTRHLLQAQQALALL